MSQASQATTQADQIKELVAQAISRYSTVHAERAATGKTAREVTAAEIEASIAKSRANGSANSRRTAEQRAERHARRLAVIATAEAHGIRFFTERNYDTFIEGETREVVGFGPNGSAQISTFHEEVKVVSPKGGLVTAWRINKEGHRFFIESADAFCRNDEVFDPLQGKEIALARFLAATPEDPNLVQPYLIPTPVTLFSDLRD